MMWFVMGAITWTTIMVIVRCSTSVWENGGFDERAGIIVAAGMVSSLAWPLVLAGGVVHLVSGWVVKKIVEHGE